MGWRRWAFGLSVLSLANGQGIAETLSRKEIVDSKGDRLPEWLSLANSEILLFVLVILGCIWFLVRRSIPHTPPAEIERRRVNYVTGKGRIGQDSGDFLPYLPPSSLPSEPSISIFPAQTLITSPSSLVPRTPPLVVQSEEDRLLIVVSPHSYGSADSEFRSTFSTKLPPIQEVIACN